MGENFIFLTNVRILHWKCLMCVFHREDLTPTACRTQCHWHTHATGALRLKSTSCWKIKYLIWLKQHHQVVVDSVSNKYFFIFLFNLFLLLKHRRTVKTMVNPYSPSIQTLLQIFFSFCLIQNISHSTN